jgi:mono/diheme cytochrome c family protein
LTPPASRSGAPATLRSGAAPAVRCTARPAAAGAALAPVLAGLVLSTACAGADPAGAPARPPATRLRTDLERAGEQVYRRERCGRCHTRLESPPPAGKPPALPGGPPAGGWRGRIGPDLGLEGHRRSDDWHYAHLYAPGALVRGSRMPPSRHLFRRAGGGLPEPGEEARALVAYLQALGRAERDIWAEWRRREPPIPAPPRVTGSLGERGRALYAEHCAACHGRDGDGRGEAAALLRLPPRDFAAGRYRFKSTPGDEPPRDADLYRTITLGGGTGSAMPGYHFLPPADRWALVLRLREFAGASREGSFGAGGGDAAGQAAPAPAGPGRAAGAAAARGERAWERLGCGACHGAAGRGGAAAIPPGDLRHACGYRGGASRAAVERAVRHGLGGGMPAYGESLPDRRTLDDLVAYLASLDAGGPGAAP